MFLSLGHFSSLVSRHKRSISDLFKNNSILYIMVVGAACVEEHIWLCVSVLNSCQIAYLENLLKVYNDEISRLQQAELSLDDLGAEDSLYIQEHKLKRKVRLGVWWRLYSTCFSYKLKRYEYTRFGGGLSDVFVLCHLLLQMMKIYEKLCELKGCNTLTGRVIEQRIHYSSSRYPEINKRVRWHFVA